MKKRSSFYFLFFLFFLMAASANGQQEYTQVAAKDNSYCNSTCTLINIRELNGNRNAVVIATPIVENGYAYTHPIGVHFINDKWSVINLDQQTMPPGSKFNVKYYAAPDPQLQFVHTVSSENLASNNTRSFIDHAGLNDNPRAQFRFISNGNGNGNNMFNIRIEFDSSAGKWYVYSIKKRPLDTNIAFNIILLSKSDIADSKKNETPVDPAKETNIQNLPTTINKSDKPAINDPKVIPAYDFSNVRICIQMGTAIGIQPPPPTAPAPIPTLGYNGEIIPVSKTSQGLTGGSGKLWSPGSTVSVGYILGGLRQDLSLYQIENYAREWEKYANIKIQFISDASKASIVVGFHADGTFWSYLGSQISEKPAGSIRQTMNFGWKDPAPISPAEVRSMVLHEFGHALGFIHESNPPPGGIHWNQDKWKSLLGSISNEAPITTIEEANHFVSNSSNFDPLSIMRYFYPATLTTDGSSVTINTDFSPTDKTMARLFYPYPTDPTSQQGVLITADCDVIDFSVQYHMVNSTIVEFVLKPAVNPNTKIPVVNEWKKIAVPTLGNSEVGLEIQNGTTTTKSVALAVIDKTRGIGFGKAKLLGVHTGLSYTWSPWPAIIGGCRVTLAWRMDKCQ